MKLKERYVFDWDRIQNNDPYHIEYSVTDICNRNCGYCSHLAPLAKRANFATETEFERTVGILHKVIPDAHTFWLTGGEPTLHPNYPRLLDIARKIFKNNYVGIYSNGTTIQDKENDEPFWKFVADNGIVWAITCYDKSESYFEEMFDKHGCTNNLAILHNGKRFFNLVNYSEGQPVTHEKYIRCGWEKSKINVRGGKIYNCPSAEFAELFNDYFNRNLKITENDYLVIDEDLTRERLNAFRKEVPFCGQCDLSKRYKQIFDCAPSRRAISEWSC